MTGKMYEGFNSEDEKVLNDLKGFIPNRVFDIHAHLYRIEELNIKEDSFLHKGPEDVGVEVWKSQIEKIVGTGNLHGGLFFPYPTAGGDLQAQNSFLSEQLKIIPNSKGLVLVSPDLQPDMAEIYLNKNFIAGFKVYFNLSKTEQSFQADITSYAPEWMWELLDRYEAVIMLHLVKSAALADTENQRQIIEMCSKYPKVKLVLAHAARGFHRYNTSKGISALRGVSNVWFDTSGICEPDAIKAIIKEFGYSKILWGTDFPISQIRGKCVTIGNGFIWITSEMNIWSNVAPDCTPVLVSIESLRALRDAAEDMGLTRIEVKDIFYNNAVKLLKL